jgi:3-carboxy-cis,cis-muconate cycloisomerase
MSYTLALSALLDPLLGDTDAAKQFSASADLEAMLTFEAMLAKAQASLGLVAEAAAERIALAVAAAAHETPDCASAVARDGVAVPGLISALRARLDPEAAAALHFGATSQDAIDTSLMLRAKPAIAGILRQLEQAQKRLNALNSAYGARPLMGRTRMQRAIPITVGDRLKVWQIGLEKASVKLRGLTFPLQLGGPAGTLEAIGASGPLLREALASLLGLACPEHCWHTQRGAVLEIGDACSQTATTTGKIGADIALMAQNELAEVKLSGGGRSSAMAHKQNPVKAEILVALARFVAALASGLHVAAVHEQERSGTSWTLEWFVLPQMIVAAAAAARQCTELLESIEAIA